MIKPRSLTSLTLCFPCYNEESNVGKMIEQCQQVAETYGCDYEILVVDDGSKDKTASIAQSYASKDSHVRLIVHPVNKGYGAAVGTCLTQAQKDLVFFTDGDNQFQVADIEKLFSKIDSCDVVAGYRIQRQDKAHRRLNGYLWTQLTRLLFAIPVRDVDCAFKLFRKSKLKNLNVESKQLLVHAEVLARLKKRGCRIEEIGITHYPRTLGQANATAPGRILSTFAELFRLYFKILQDR